MSYIEAVSRQLAEALKGHNADCIEARLEESRTSHITYRGRELESIGKTTSVGGNVRALARGGWGFVSFNNLDELPGKVELAVKQAQFVGKEESKLAPIEPAVEVVPTKITNNPLTISLGEKKQLLDEYNGIIWQTLRIQTSIISYSDSHKKTIFLNSSGSYVEQERTDVTLRLVAVAAKDGDVQQVGLSLGSRDDIDSIQGIHSQVEQLAQRAVKLLSAPQVKGGEYSVVLDPVLAGVFVHEAFGHLSEADFVYENDRLREIMTLGKRFGSPNLNIVDTATLPGLRGSYKYDDEGIPSQCTPLITEGTVSNFLYDLQTAALADTKSTGNGRRSGGGLPAPSPNAFIIAPGDTTLDEMIRDMKEGLVVEQVMGATQGNILGGDFSGNVLLGYKVESGKIVGRVKDTMVSGNIYQLLKQIAAIGSDAKWVGGSLKTPSIYCPNVSVASK